MKKTNNRVSKPVSKSLDALPRSLKNKQVLENAGIDSICQRIIEGESMTAIATDLGMQVGSLRYWISTDSSRSAQVREARALTAQAFDDEALARIDAAQDAFELAKAREAAQHLRWRASAIAPRDYGLKVDVSLDARISITGALEAARGRVIDCRAENVDSLDVGE